MVMKIIVLLICMLLLSGCGGDSSSISPETIPDEKSVSEDLQEKRADNEYCTFIKKSEDRYEVIPKGERIRIRELQKNPSGILFNLIVSASSDEDEELFSYYCYEEETNSLREIYRLTPDIYMSYGHHYDGKVISLQSYFANEKQRFRILEISVDGSKELFDDVTTFFPKTSLSGDELYISYEDEAYNYLKRIDLKTYEVQPIVKTKRKTNEGGDLSVEEIALVSGYDDVACYVMHRINEKKEDIFLVEYSISEKKEITRYPLERSLKELFVREDVIIGEETDPDYPLESSGCIFVRENGKLKKVSEIEGVSTSEMLISHLFTKDNVFFNTRNFLYKYDVGKREYETVEFRKPSEYIHPRYIDKGQFVTVSKTERGLEFKFQNVEEMFR